MHQRESLRRFLELHGQNPSLIEPFNVYERGGFSCAATSLMRNRRDFYKISLIVNGSGVFTTADRAIDINGNALLFMNPMVPYAWDPTTEEQTGYFCLFTEPFVDTSFANGKLAHSPLFRVGSNFVFFPDNPTMRFLTTLFERMHVEKASAYAGKYEILRNYVQLIMHEALKLNPADGFYRPSNAHERIFALFTDLLERQFPIDLPGQAVQLRTANDFARQLNVHTNHLNRLLREQTGRTTSEWIAERIVKEAKALLRNSDWDVAEIGYALGFEHASNFHTFFKKHTGRPPSQYRKWPV